MDTYSIARFLGYLRENVPVWFSGGPGGLRWTRVVIEQFDKAISALFDAPFKGLRCRLDPHSFGPECVPGSRHSQNGLKGDEALVFETVSTECAMQTVVRD